MKTQSLLLFVLVPLVAALAPLRPGDTRVLDTCVGQRGAVFVLESSEPLRLDVRAVSGEAEPTHFDLSNLEEGTRVVAARLLIWDARGRPDEPILAVAVEAGGRTAYYYVERAQDGSAHCEPIFTSDGKPFRIADFHNPGSDSIEIAFRRGYVGVRGPLDPLEERYYVNECPPLRRAARLIDPRSGEELQLDGR